MVGTALLIAIMIVIVIGALSLFRYFLTGSGRARTSSPATGHLSQSRLADGGDQAHFPRIKFVADGEKPYEYVGYMGL